MRTFLLAFAVSLALLSAIAVALSQIDYAKQSLVTQRSMQADTALHAQAMEWEVATHLSDLSVLSNQPIFRRFLRTGTEDDLRETQDTFKAFMETKTSVRQLRYIDRAGMEVIRVDRRHEGLVFINTGDLQDKGDRYYFRETIKQPAGAVYTSPLDLNVEHGAVVTPWEPTIRLATPIAAPSGTGTTEENIGILIVNFSAETMLKSGATHPVPDRQTVILNKDGYWLAGAPTEKLWGFMFENGPSFAAATPEAWTQISSRKSGLFEIGRKIFAFNTARSPGTSDGWVIVSNTSLDPFAHLYDPNLQMTAAVTTLLLCWISWVWSGVVDARRKAAAYSNLALQVMDNSNTVMFAKNMDGRYILSNHAFKKLFRVEDNGADFGTVQPYVDPETAEKAEALDRQIFETGEPGSIEAVIHDGDAKRIFFATKFPIRDERGEIKAVGGVSTDVTALKKIEAALIDEKERAVEASKAKSAFLANMSHELRTPLNAVIGYSEMILEDIDEQLDLDGETIRPDIARINSSGRHLLALINDILDLSKIEAGKMKLAPEEIDFADLVEDVVTTAKPLADKTGNTLAVDIAGASNANVFNDPTKMRQILLNLLGNAAKFTSKGQISLTAMVEPRESRDFLKISIADTGIGMEQDLVERLFEDFIQADASATRRFEGTGLGLSISRRIVALMGGWITVESEVGKGSNFTVMIPASVATLSPTTDDQAEMKDDRSAVLGNSANSTTVLIIDDDPSARELMSRHLMRKGFSVATAESGSEGIALAEKLKPDAITLDILLPPISGWDVLSLLKEKDSTRDIPVIMCSIIEDRETGVDLGAVEHLVKPINRDALVKIVSRYTSIPNADYVLVVDDDERERTNMAAAAKSLAGRVEAVENGYDAIDVMERQGLPKLILLDLVMPEMDGFAFLHEVRADPKKRTIPVIVVTAKELSEEELDFLNSSARTVVEKGKNDLPHILDKISREIAGRSKRRFENLQEVAE